MNKGDLLGHEIQGPSYYQQLINMTFLTNGSSVFSTEKVTSCTYFPTINLFSSGIVHCLFLNNFKNGRHSVNFQNTKDQICWSTQQLQHGFNMAHESVCRQFSIIFSVVHYKPLQCLETSSVCNTESYLCHIFIQYSLSQIFSLCLAHYQHLSK